MVGGHVAEALREFEDAVDGTQEVADEDVADELQLAVGDGLSAEPVEFGEYLPHGVVGVSGGNVGKDVEDYGVAVDLGVGVDAVGVAFVFALVAHESRAEVAAEECGEDEEGGVVGMVPGEREEATDAEGGLYGLGERDAEDWEWRVESGEWRAGCRTWMFSVLHSPFSTLHCRRGLWCGVGRCSGRRCAGARCRA